MISSILQPAHLLIVLAVVLLVLGPKRLPGAGRALGQGLREFKTSIRGETEPDGDEYERLEPHADDPSNAHGKANSVSALRSAMSRPISRCD